MTKPLRWMTAAAALAAVAMTATPAGGAAEKSKAAEKKYRIAVIPKGTTHDFWKSVHAGAEKAGKEAGAEVIWKGPLKEDDRDGQIRIVETFLAQKVNGIVLAPLDRKALVPVVRRAIGMKITVVIIDSDLDYDGTASFVATDNYKGGVLAAHRLAWVLGKKGRIIMMRYAEGSASTSAREQGFLDTIQKEYPDIKVLSLNQYGGATTEMSQRKAETLLLQFTDIDGIFCPNESTTFGMLLALQASNRAGKVKFVGFDSNLRLNQALRDGSIQGLVLQNPMRMGYLGVQTMLQHLNGQKVEKRIDTGAVVATPENMNTPEIKQLLEPPKV